MQGLRIQMDDHSKKNQMYKLHGSIRTGLQSVRSIGYDIASIASQNPRSSILHSKMTSSPLVSPKKDEILAASVDQINKTMETMKYTSPEDKYSDDIDRLARLAIVEQELSQMTPSVAPRDMTGADIVMATMTDSLIAQSYAQQYKRIQQESQGPGKGEKDV
jgi:hypothetical protein